MTHAAFFSGEEDALSWPERRQFDELLREHRAAWNSHPNPKFELDAIATGCVAVVRAEHDPVRRVLTQARLNCAARAAADADQRG